MSSELTGTSASEAGKGRQAATTKIIVKKIINNFLFIPFIKSYMLNAKNFCFIRNLPFGDFS
jgi:hypothetical protein